ncbi:hypothetical protein [Calothrix sp. NIES-2098]|uniref:hypothetical protein n=1 Tax=Calothrix sp. NIES-2098 TaxID=1954171 RepID=UPI000B60C4FF|nr:hypothetical protein NIES2098_02050 [Calothrix sp. NIES-2098]
MQKHNYRLFFHKHNLILIFLICLSLSIGYFLGTQSLNKPLYAQEPLTAIAIPSTNSKINTPLPQSSNSPKEDTQDALELMKEYNKSLLDTIFLSLVGTVVTISLTFFGYQWFTSVLSREQDKEAITRKLQDWLEKEELVKIQNNLQENLWTATEEKLYRIEVKLKWLEYQVSVLSAEQIDIQQQVQQPFYFKEYQTFNQPIALQERLRAIRILQNLQYDYQGSAILECLEEELGAIKYIFYSLNNHSLNANPNLKIQLEQMKNILRELHSNYDSEQMQEIEERIHLLENS